MLLDDPLDTLSELVSSSDDGSDTTRDVRFLTPDVGARMRAFAGGMDRSTTALADPAVFLYIPLPLDSATDPGTPVDRRIPRVGPRELVLNAALADRWIAEEEGWGWVRRCSIVGDSAGPILVVRCRLWDRPVDHCND